MEKIDITKAKHGDVLVQCWKNDILGNILIFDKIDDEGMVRYVCWYSIENDTLSYKDAEKTHLGFADGETQYYREATLTERIILERALDIRNLYYDDDEEKLMNDGGEIGKPHIDTDELSNNIMIIRDLNLTQRAVIDRLIDSWNGK